MNPLDRPTTIVTGASAFLVAVSGILTNFTSLGDQLQKSLEKFVALPVWAIWAISSVLIVLLIYLVWSRRRRRSILVRPERLRLERSNENHLVGRADDN